MPGIRKKQVMWEELNALGIVDWARVLNTPSTYSPSAHALVGAKHTASGLTIGHVVRASGAAAFAWAQLQHSDLGGVTSDLHHPQAHTLASHSTKPHSALTGVTSDQHHAQNHASRHQLGGADAIKLDDLATPDDNSNLNATISRHGLFRKLSNLPAQCVNGMGDWMWLYDSTSIIIGILSVVGTTIRNANSDVRTTDSQAWTKLKETELGDPTGKMKIYFEMKGVNTTGVRGRIYKNGVAIGTERFTLSTSYQSYTQDLGGFDSGDLIQIYAKCDEAEDLVYIRNLWFKYERSINILGKHTLNTPIAIAWEIGDEFSMTHQDP